MEKITPVRRITKIAALKCPNCGTAKVFYKAKLPFITKPVMRERCENCGYQFHGEPGHYNGVAFVSYGLALIEGVLAYLAARQLIFGLSTITLLLISAGVMMFCAMWNFRLARVIWLNMFPVNK